MRESFVADAHFLMRYRFATLALVGAPRGARRGRKIADTTGLRLSARHPPSIARMRPRIAVTSPYV